MKQKPLPPLAVETALPLPDSFTIDHMDRLHVRCRMYSKKFSGLVLREQDDGTYSLYVSSAQAVPDDELKVIADVCRQFK